MALDYELAKELKEAGYPQDLVSAPYHRIDFKDCAQPTLSELIEACGEQFGGMTLELDKRSRTGKVWKVYSGDGSNILIFPTPEEAVARLWLALNRV